MGSYADPTPDTALTYTDYTAVGGSTPEPAFNALVARAVRMVDAAIGGNVVTPSTFDTYRLTVFTIVDELANPSVTSERIGNTTVAYSEARTCDEIISDLLAGTGLLYRGI